MANTDTTIAPFRKVAQKNPALHWYAIADSAQHKNLPSVLLKNGAQVKCLLGSPQGSPVARHSPHLISLQSPLQPSDVWSWICLNAKKSPCLSIVAARISFDTLFRQLATCTEVRLPDGDTMFFAFWDPAILGTMMGQADDNTLHVKGPVLNPIQRAMFTSMMALWCYWDRDGGAHSIAIESECSSSKAEILSLSQEQVDGLVEASVPDHILYYIQLNHPDLIAAVPSHQRYERVRSALNSSRTLGLYLMMDLVNYVCIELIYNDRMHSDSSIVELLRRVREKEISFVGSLHLFP